ncbi:Fumarylacetoacetase [Colletotrichum sidae]|uniref:Fumarylacetoacetase n=1 Tax=Colletotrichum sidae TaxID=1347389 RepID=A0A4R8TCD5_9PEZI|nr:Fumarylacetoacetase [Colletotrichum sidae]
MSSKIDIPPNSPFTIHNIPFGVISTKENGKPRCAIAIGSYALDLTAYAKEGRLEGHAFPFEVFSQPSLNAFAALPRKTRAAVREALIRDIKEDNVPESCLVDLDVVTMHLPFQIGGYSDFYCSLEHVQNCSALGMGVNIPTNWYYAPSVYNGRASSVVPSPQPIRRPRGVYYDTDGQPTYGASQKLDYELEMGVFVSKPIEQGSEMKIQDAEEHIFGLVLLNDWSARDIQVFEMKPLGPFHGKGFGTSISPWVVTLDALQPFRCSPKTKQEPAPFPHLKWPRNEDATVDVKLQVSLIRKGKKIEMATSNLKYLYWTPFQQLAHHASAMCGLGTGDLIGTGTVSGDAQDGEGRKLELGCLYEATNAGTRDVQLPDGTTIKYLGDGDEVILQAWCGDMEGNGVSLGFGECRGVVLPAHSD